MVKEYQILKKEIGAMDLEQLLNLTEEEALLKEEARRFAEEVIEPIAEETLNMNTFSPVHYKRVFEKLAENGFTAMGIPEEYGGADISSRASTIFTEELCRIDGANGLSAGATSSLVASPINIFGTDEQKERWLPAIAAGDVIGAYCQTEPDAGSDVAGIKAKAEEKDGKWLITGTKRFITNGSEADLALVIARTGRERHKGLTAFLVDCNKAREAGTLDTSKNEHKAGLHQSPTTEMVFMDCEAESILGDIGTGWIVAMTTLTGSRATVIPAQAVGIMRGAYEIARQYVAERKQFGEPIGNFPVIKRDLVKMEAGIEVSRLLTWQSALLKDAAPSNDSRPFALEASCAKLVASELAERVTSEAMQLLGGNGYVMEYKIAKFWHDARIVKIYEGASHIQKRIIIGEFFKRYGMQLMMLKNMDPEEQEKNISDLALTLMKGRLDTALQVEEESRKGVVYKWLAVSLWEGFILKALELVPKFDTVEEYGQYFTSNQLDAEWFDLAWAYAYLRGVTLYVFSEVLHNSQEPNYMPVTEALKEADKAIS